LLPSYESPKVEDSPKRRFVTPILYGDVPTFMEAPAAKNPSELKDATVAVLGIPWEGLKVKSPRELLPATAAPAGPNSIYFRTGADKAPEAIRKNSIYYSIYHGGYFPELDRGLRLLDHISIVDYGNVEVVVGDAEETYKRAELKVLEIIDAEAIPLVFGGDHGVTYPVLRALSQRARGKIGIIQFDSHFDLDKEFKYWAGWQFMGAYELGKIDPKNHVQIGIRGLRNPLYWYKTASEHGLTVFTMADVQDRGLAAVAEEALRVASNGTEGIYVTLDIDVVDPAYCPAQKYPDPGGLTSREIIQALRIVSRKGVLGFDLCCLGAQYDDPTGIGAQLAARCVVEIVGSIALSLKKAKETRR